MTCLPDLIIIYSSPEQRFRSFWDAAVIISYRALQIGVEPLRKTFDEVL